MRKVSNAALYQLSCLFFGLFITMFCSPLPAGAQSPEGETGLPFITNYAPRTFKALPQVWAIQEDDRGIMYFGVQNYILEYDGIKWRKISLQYNPSAVVRSFAKYRDGHIYYGGFSDLGYIDRDSLGQTVARSLVPQIPEKNRDFFDVWSTYSTDKGIYFQSREYIFRFQENKTDKGPKWQVKIWKPTTRFMYAFYVDSSYYVHQQGLGLFKMTDDSLELIPGSEFLGKERVQVMLPYPAGPNGEKQYLIGRFYSGLSIYNGSTFRPFPTKADPIIKSGVVLYKGIRLSNGNYILSSTGKGLLIIDPQGNLIEKIDRNIGLQDESVYATYFDSRGILWLGLDNGISRVDINSPLTQFGLQSGITAGVLNAYRFQGTMYVGTSNGLLAYDSNSRLFHVVPGVTQNQVFSIISDGNELMVAGDGLFEIKNKKAVVARPSISGDLTLAYIDILKKHPGILLGGALFGIPVFEADKESVYSNGGKKMDYLGNIPGCTDQIWTFSEDSDGTVWAGTQNSRVYRLMLAFDNFNHLDLKKTKVEQYGPDQGVNGLMGNVINLRGKTYFVTDSSLLRFDNAQKKFILDTTFGRFPNGGASLESAFAEDSSGRVWIRVGKETRLAVPKPGGGYALDESRFKSLSEHTIQNIYPEKDGILWICTTDGLIRYDERLEKDHNLSFRTILRHIEAGNTVLGTAVSDNETGFQVAASNNTLRFEYAAPFFEQEEKMRYQTWLQGFEDGWSGLDVNYYKEYTNLGPGKYTFHVRASNIYQNLSKEATYSFEILPPWYRSWWAYLAYALAATGLIVTIIRWRTKQLQQKHRELEKVVEDRTTQLSHRVEELAVINSVQGGLARETNVEGIFELVGEKVRQIFQPQVIDIATCDKKSGTLEDRYSFEKGDRSLTGRKPLGGFRKKVIESAQPLLLKGNMLENPEEFDNPVVSGENPKSAMFVPLISGSEATGVISIQDIDRENAFSESDLSLLSTLGNSMSVALESAKRFDETKRLLKAMEQRTAELAVINSVQEGLVRELNMQGIYDLVGERIRQIFDAQVIDIVTYDGRNKLITDKYSFEKGDRSLVGAREPRGFRKSVIDTKKTIVFNEDVDRHSADYGNEVLIGERPKSVVFVPLMSGPELKGIISIQNLDHENAFSDSDVSLLSTLANSMSVALENARLFDETNRLLSETEHRSAELGVINNIQEGLAHELDVQGIYNLVGDRLGRLFKAQSIIIAGFDLKNHKEHFHYLVERGERFYPEDRPIDGIRQLIIEKRSNIYIETEDQARTQFGVRVIGETLMPKSLLFVPLLSASQVKGYISLQNVDQERAFSASDVRLLETLANSMTVALENARLFQETTRLLKETEQRTAELSMINSVQEGLVREMDMQAIYDLVGNRLCELFDTQTVIIRTFDLRAETETWQFAIERGQRLFSYPRPLIWANKQLVITRQPLLINDNYEQTAKRFGGAGVSKGLPPRSAIFVPIVVADVIRGSISLQNVERENAFSENDVRLLTTLTNGMGVAIENARLFDETNRLLGEAKQRANELAAVNRVSQALALQLDVDQIVSLVGDQVRDLFRANIVYVALYDPKTQLIQFPYQHGDNLRPLKLGEGLTSRIILTREALLLNKDTGTKTHEMGIVRIGTPAASYLGVPIPVGDEIIGVVSVQSTEMENRFTESDQRLLSTIAASVGTAIKKARLFEEVQQAKQQAEDASKTAEKANQAKSAFLSTVSHELRTPLTSVLGFAKIIKKRLEERVFPATSLVDPRTGKTMQQVSDNLNVVISEGERLTNLINDVLDLAKIEAGKMEWNMETVSVQEILERAIAATSSLFDQKSLVLEKHIDPSLPPIQGDKDKLIQVAVNLISNAVKFTPTGNVICRAERNDNEVVVTVEDTGIGIAPQDYDAVFEQFKQVTGDTLTDKPKGTGLGLPICKEIIEHHGGRIWLTSVVGKGSKFLFALPAQKTNGTTPIHLNDLVKQLKEHVAQSQFNISKKYANIMVVDDDESIRSLLRQELGDVGYIIEEAANGKEALAKIRQKQPDLIILDVMMPEMNGFDVAAVLKNDPTTMNIPIIILSVVQDKARGFRIGVDRYLTKPIDTGTLFTEVGHLLEQGKSSKKVMVVDEDSTVVKSLTEVLQEKGYQVVESNGREMVEKAIAAQPDIIILNSLFSDKQETVQSLRFEKGLENVLFLIYK